MPKSAKVQKDGTTAAAFVSLHLMFVEFLGLAASVCLFSLGRNILPDGSSIVPFQNFSPEKIPKAFVLVYSLILFITFIFYIVADAIRSIEPAEPRAAAGEYGFRTRDLYLIPLGALFLGWLIWVSLAGLGASQLAFPLGLAVAFLGPIVYTAWLIARAARTRL